jgi:microcystin-dependent protein
MPTVNPTLPNDGEDADAVDISGPILAILSVLNGHIDEDNLEDGGVILSKLATSVANALVPVGSLLPYAGSSSPSSSWLLCYGQEVSRSTYSSLYAVIGDLYGAGNGTTTFNLPDLRGRIPVGNDAMGGSAANRIQRSTTLTTTNGSPTATVGSATGLSVGMKVSGNTNVPAGTTINAISGTTLTLSANATGAGTNVATRFSIVDDAQTLGKAGGADVHVLTAAQLAAHQHATPVVTGSSGAITGFGNVQDQNVTATSRLATVANVGDQAHPNMQPSQITNYIIKV